MEIKKIDLDRAELSSDSPIANESVKPIISKPDTLPMKKQNLVPVVLVFILVITGGIFTGGFLKNGLANSQSGSLSGNNANIQSQVPVTGAKIGDVYGSADEKAFKDKATGVIDKGGFNGEGSHKLVRPGGISQTVYLTSSVIDLDTLVGHQVTIWGETFKGQKVGWLMDVGRAKIENLNVPLPI